MLVKCLTKFIGMHSVSFNGQWCTVTSTVPGMQKNLSYVSYYCRRMLNQKPELVPRLDSLRDTGRSR
jgi:hypothetical protein